MQSSLCIYIGILCGFYCCIQQAYGIGCFVCSSVDGSDPDCEDAFNTRKNRFYVSECSADRKGRSGLFPASECVKMKGTMTSTGHSVVVRTCGVGVDNGGVITEAEMGRESHFVYDGEDVYGRVLACSTDGCNTASPKRQAHAFLMLLPATILMFLLPWVK